MQRIPIAELSKNILKLPRLPIPHVSATADRYRAGLPALRTGEPAVQHLARMDNFLEVSAGVLQKTILEREKAAIESGEFPYAYTEPVMYANLLNSRAPLEVNLNSSFILKPLVPVAPAPSALEGRKNTQAGVAAALVYGIAKWIWSVQKEGLLVKDPQMDVSPLLSEFGRSLIPSKDKDTLHTTPLEKLRHVVVLHDGHPYVVKVFDEKQQVLNRALIQRAMELILSITPDGDNTSPVTVLTAANRAMWGQTYQELIQSPENAEALQCFHESLLVVCLDSKGWGDTPKLAEASGLHGSLEELENRWYDKHQMIVSADGQVAFNFEPTASQPVHWARWVGDVLELVQSEMDPIVMNTSTVDGAAAAQIMNRLCITYGKSFAGHIRSARQEALSLVSDTELNSLTLPFGTSQLAKLKISPNAFVQLTLQLARHALHDRLCATSRTCPTTGYFHGSSDVVRCATTEALALAEAVVSYRKHVAGSMTAATGASPVAEDATQSTNTAEELASRIYVAAASYDNLQKEATRGEGIDRHLMVLRDIAVVNGDKAALAFFEDDIYHQTCKYLLHTCECSHPWMRHYACGPLHSNGYGVGYVIDANEIRISIAAYTNRPATNVGDMTAAIVRAASLIVDTLTSTAS